MPEVKLSPETPLNDRQNKFCQEYVVDCNGTQAAIRAGYSAKTAGSIASELLTKTKVRRRIRALQLISEARSEISKEGLQQRLLSIADRCMQAEPVLDRDGNQVYVETADGDSVPAYQFNPTAATRAIYSLGKSIAMFTEKVELTGADGAPLDPGIPLHLLSEATLEAIKADLDRAAADGET